MDWADWAEYKTERIGADGADSWADRADRADSIILDGADWGGRGKLADEGGRAGLGGEGLTARTRRGADGTDEADGAEGGIWGGLGSLGRACRRTRRTDNLGCARPGRLASSRLRAEGIRDMLSPDVDCGVIWLHTLGIHIRFFCAHVVVIFLETHTSKAERASLDDKFFGSLGALNITYSMFIQMGHAIRDVIIVTYKGGLSSLVPPSPLCTSCCS